MIATAERMTSVPEERDLPGWLELADQVSLNSLRSPALRGYPLRSSEQYPEGTEPDEKIDEDTGPHELPPPADPPE